MPRKRPREGDVLAHRTPTSFSVACSPCCTVNRRMSVFFLDEPNLSHSERDTRCTRSPLGQVAPQGPCARKSSGRGTVVFGVRRGDDNDVDRWVSNGPVDDRGREVGNEKERAGGDRLT